VRALVASLLLVACHDGATPDPGLGSLLQVAGKAQFRPGPFPADEGGPQTIDLSPFHVSLVVGRLMEAIDGTLDVPARAWVIGIGRDDGTLAPDTWLLPAQTPDFDTPDFPSAHARVGVVPEFPLGPFDLVIAAADEDGRFGAPVRARMLALPEDAPAGELVIQLVWEGNADLDIHVIEPGPFGGEAFADDPNTFDPVPGEPVDPAEPPKHGIIDHDGNKDCRRQANPSEAVVWTMPPPAGEYIVRVDAPSMCGDASVAWFVTAYRTINGVTETLGSARGVSTQEDVEMPRGRGAGVLALRFSL
jgi:hypothetical protein